GQIFAFGAHAVVDRIAHGLGQLDALDAHVQHLDSELTGGLVGLVDHFLRNGFASTRNQLVQRARVDLEVQRILDDRSQALARLADVAGGGLVIRDQIVNAPVDVKVDFDAFLFLGEIAFRLRVQRLDAGVEIGHLLYERQLEVQPRLEVGLLDLAVLQHDGAVSLAHREHAGKNRDHDDDEGDDGPELFHCVFSWPLLDALDDGVPLSLDSALPTPGMVCTLEAPAGVPAPSLR